MNGHQGTQPVTAAFPYWNGRLAPVFDTARQMLVVTAGCGRVQQEGHAMQEIRPGDAVTIPANIRHWHGAAPTTAKQRG